MIAQNAEYLRSQSKPNKAALSFSVSDEPGSLMRVLSILGSYGLNMTKLESRPIPGKPWEYTFFVEVQLKDDDSFNKAVEEIKAAAVSFRDLGHYTSVL